MGDTLVAGLMTGDCCHYICVRASRLWDFCDPQDEERVLHTDLVLIDEEGNSIHAQIYPPLNEEFKPMIKEGKVYNIKYFLVKKANKFYKPVENSNMINFTRWTRVEEVLEVPPAFPLLTYKLTPMEQIPARVDYREYFTDVIGVITTVSNVSTQRTRMRQFESFKRTVTIRNASDVQLKIVLWGERATSFPAEQVHKDGQDSPQIIIFVGTLVKSYADGVSLTGGSSCKWYINPAVQEVRSLESSVKGMHQPIVWDQLPTSIELAAFTVAERKKIAEIKYLHPFENKKKEWLVTVKVLKIDKSWWHNSCKKCLKTAKPHGDTYKCTNLGCNSIGVPSPRYKLAITAEDETGQTEFIIFGRIAQRLIKKTVDTLISDNPVGFIPDDITMLLEKVFEWNVSFTENTIVSGNVSFQVNAIIAEIDGGRALPATPGSQSSSLMLSQGASVSMQSTQKVVGFPMPLLAADSEASHTLSATLIKSSLPIIEPLLTPQGGKGDPADEAAAGQSDDTGTPDKSVTKTHRSVTKKRTHTSPSKKTAKKLFTDDGAGDDNVDSCAEP